MSEFHFLRIRLAMESLISEREMMMAMNEWRARRGESQAYGDEAFSNLITQFTALGEELRNIR